MADKEATVYIVDVGKSMGQRRNGRDITDLEWAMKYIWDCITNTVATGRKMAMLGVIGLKTDGTDNELGDESHFSHISVLSEIKQFLMSDIRELGELIKPSNVDKGDAISALILAIQMIITHCKKLKWKRKIVLVTNGMGRMNSENLEDIVSKVKEDNIELIILGPDFDDAEYGTKEEDKDPRKAANEALLRTVSEQCDGVFGTLEQAVEEMATPRVKAVRPVASFKGFLQLGNPEEYDTAVRIPVERYPRTMVAKPPTASQFVLRSNTASGEEGQESATVVPESQPEDGSSLTNVRNLRTYQVNDESAPGGKIDIERDELAKGYEYGRTAVHISETDENITRLETTAALELVGFIQSERYERYMHLSNTHIIISSRANDKASLALSSFIHALFELESYAVARLVTKENKPPILVLLAPSIEPEYECLLEVQLPFAEDVRTYRFPPLDKVVTVSGKVVTQHRNLPNDDLLNAMDKYVDSMELKDTDEDGDLIDTPFPIEDSFSPVLHRVNAAIRSRAIHPSDPIPPPAKILTQFSQQPDQLLQNADRHLKNLMEVADVKKVPPKAKGRKRAREPEKPLSGLDVDALLHQEKRVRISPNNAIPEFKQTLAQAETIETTKDAVKQMRSIIEDQIRNSLGDANYDRVTEGLGVVREELISYEEPGHYNEFITELKEALLKEKLGGDRRELWWLVKRSKLGLIEQRESELSEVTEEEAKKFLSAQ
ncbi:ATP-dependent DNA helicase 2 subunit KU80 [Aspergillus mulundensis]|uniref:ATP-dependent DNA helicase II subunit 2 n=1 Tax=Aspergillus mulundensis TaxID=1810919 RepID=A0A3D8Q6T1_9EURO|nr:ATP-dependent DNA helicase II subunit 2 [Aspergillus mulundensis]XP_026601469.1 ATP-dependent DNA helicase II subunit 2 [Aspergillus mulundensis]RDW57523.1 ATP-dependent DNA helicase II subunit 2 [Aspergillus mulundensis]RDW72249.1 ATP-dependent DNA helicase II subunit 2 [Aspergillus mulundensis]